MKDSYFDSHTRILREIAAENERAGKKPFHRLVHTAGLNTLDLHSQSPFIGSASTRSLKPLYALASSLKRLGCPLLVRQGLPR